MEKTKKTTEEAHRSWQCIGLSLCIAAIPLVQIKEISDVGLLSRHIYLGIVALMAMLFAGTKSYINPYPKTFVYSLLALCGLYLAESFTALNTPEAFYTTARIFLFAVWVWTLGILFLRSQQFAQAVYLGLLLAAVVGLFLLIKEVFALRQAGTQLWDKKNLYELHTAYGHKNLYASFTFIAAGLGLFYKTANRYLSLLKWLVIGLLAASLLLVQTKAALLGALVALGVYLIGSRLLSAQNKSLRLGLVLILTIPLLLLGIIYLFPQKFTLILNNDTVIERAHLWRNSGYMFLEHPFWGVGPGNWQVYFPKYGLTHFMETNYLISDGFTTFQRPHNDFLWVLNELGLPGLMAFAFLFLLALYSALKGAKKGNSQSLGLGCLLLGYVVVSAVDFPMERNEHLLLLATLMASIFATQHTTQTAYKSISLAIPAALLLFSFGVALNRLPQEKLCKKMISAHRNSDFARMYTAASKINEQYLSIDNFSIPVAWYKALYHHALGEIDKALENAREAYAITPYQLHVINNLAGLLALKGMDAQAEKLYKEALDISTVQPDILLNLCSVQYNQGKLHEAMTTLFRFKPDSENTQYMKCLEVVGMAYCKELGKNNCTPLILLQLIKKIKTEKDATFDQLKNLLP